MDSIRPAELVLMDAAKREDALPVGQTHECHFRSLMGLWLPRGIDATLIVDYDGEGGRRPLSTKTADDATCVAKLQLG